jgi:hypothetical protein
MPTKKPRKRQKPRSPPLRDEHKAAHTAWSRVRIFMEHAIGGMKRSHILVHVFHNRKGVRLFFYDAELTKINKL